MWRVPTDGWHRSPTHGRLWRLDASPPHSPGVSARESASSRHEMSAESGDGVILVEATSVPPGGPSGSGAGAAPTAPVAVAARAGSRVVSMRIFFPICPIWATSKRLANRSVTERVPAASRLKRGPMVRCETKYFVNCAKILHIRWLQHGRYTKLLGVPFWASGEDNSFWDDLYIKIKSAIAAWRDLTRLTQHGRVMLANFMIYSRPRYWAQAMLPPASSPMPL
eukprot:scaffold2109_cov123-Isochrysis_galbana.AAC.6